MYSAKTYRRGAEDTEAAQRFTEKKSVVLCATSLSLWLMLSLLTSIIGYRRLSAEASATHSKEGFEMPVQERARVRAPELVGGRGWLNIDKPLSLAALKGKVVLLDFWTYGCINCMHIIPDLKKLEHKYPNELVVIGVHSAKFENEKESDNIRIGNLLLFTQIRLQTVRRTS